VADIKKIAKEWVERGDVQALVMLAARRGIIVLHEAIGLQTPDRDSPPLAKDAIFPIASITKVITATAVMILVEEGKVGLNRRVAEYLPEFSGEGRDAVLVRHLLTHTSGLRDDPNWTFESLTSRSEQLSLAFETPLSGRPGEAMAYCQYNFELLSEVVGRACGESLGDFCDSRIFQPLGMKDTHCGLRGTARPRIVRRPSGAWASGIDRPVFDGGRWGSTAAWSTASDLAVFGQTFLNQGLLGDQLILSPASVAAMTRNQIPGIPAKLGDEVFPEASWGYGWSVHGQKTGKCGGLYPANAFESWGAGGSYTWVDPASDVVGVYLSVVPRPETDPWVLHYRMNDLFADAVTAAIAEA
jgi:CubicO group peptidase (beta-lactamase class C family)